MDLSIVIVSWNTKDLLRKCLQSIYQYKNNIQLEIFVVDNNSQDGSVDMVAKEFPEVKLIANKENKGFAGANNQAIKLSTGKYVLLLNPDTEVLPETIGESINYMENHARCGIMGCQMLNPDMSLQPSVRRFPVLWPILLMFLKLPKLLSHIASIDRYLATDFDYTKEQDVDQVMGAFMMVRREFIDKGSMLDEDFFIWFEEVDLCKRCWKAGFTVSYYPDARVIHYGGQSFSQQKVINKQFRFFNSALIYFKKHGFNNKLRS